jgi:hypothetical protein
LSKLQLALPHNETTPPLTTQLVSSHSLTGWFQLLDKLMKYSLAKLICQRFDESMRAQLSEALGQGNSSTTTNDGNYPSQVVLLVEHLVFVLNLGKLLLDEQRRALTTRQ